MPVRADPPAGSGSYRQVPGSPGDVLMCLREKRASSRPELVECTGMSRAVIAQRVEALMAVGLVVEDGTRPSTGGRRAVRLRFGHEAGVVAVGHLGATHSRLAVTDLAGEVLADLVLDWPIRLGPVRTLERVAAEFRSLLEAVGRSVSDLRGIGIGVPGPVQHVEGRPVSPGLMPGWDGFPIAEHLGDQFEVPVFVDNDVNLMALGEYELVWHDRVADLVFVKVGTGIGCGIIASGQIYRGAQGAAGDIGHIRVGGREDAVCRCGNSGCLSAVAGGEAIAARLTEKGHDAPDARAVSPLVLAGEREAIREVRESGRVIGEALSAVVNVLNPAVIVVGGDVAEGHEQLLAGIREVVYQRSLVLATRQLRLVHSQLGDRSGVIGASLMVVDEVLSPAAVDRLAETARMGPASASGDETTQAAPR